MMLGTTMEQRRRRRINGPNEIFCETIYERNHDGRCCHPLFRLDSMPPNLHDTYPVGFDRSGIGILVLDPVPAFLTATTTVGGSVSTRAYRSEHPRTYNRYSDGHSVPHPLSMMMMLVDVFRLCHPDTSPMTTRKRYYY